MFYGEKLKGIREMFSYSRKDLADCLQLSEQAIWQFETNQSDPSFQTINALKELFYVRTQYFFTKPYIEKVSSISQIAYREKTRGSRKKIKFEKNYLNFIFSHLSEIERKISPEKGKILDIRENIEKEYDLTNLSLSDIKGIAQKTREKLNIQSNNRLMFQLEVNGVYLIERDLEKEIDAYSTWLLDSTYPLIILNNGKNGACRRNFDMGHELGHLLLHGYIDHDELEKKEILEIESEANLFSSYFLLPEQEFKEDFYSLDKRSNPHSYISLKEKYKMSIQSMAYRAYSEGWLSKSENRYFWRKIYQYGYKENEPLDDELTVVIPGKIRALLQQAFDKNILNLNQLLDEYQVDIEYFEKLFCIKDDLLRQYLTLPTTNLHFKEDHFELK